MSHVARFLIFVLAVAFFAGCVRHIHTISIPLMHASDDVVSYMHNGKFIVASNPQNELIIGDATTYYGMTDCTTYLRFSISALPTVRIEDIVHAELQLCCSYGGNDAPMLTIRTIDLPSIKTLRETPWLLPQSSASITWCHLPKAWMWKTHEWHTTPNLAPLLRAHLRRYPKNEIVFVIANHSSCHDQFKGICSFDDEPLRAAQLVIRYRSQ